MEESCFCLEDRGSVNYVVAVAAAIVPHQRWGGTTAGDDGWLPSSSDDIIIVAGREQSHPEGKQRPPRLKNAGSCHPTVKVVTMTMPTTTTAASLATQQSNQKSRRYEDGDGGDDNDGSSDSDSGSGVEVDSGDEDICYMTNPPLRYILFLCARASTGSVTSESKSVTSPVTNAKKMLTLGGSLVR